MINLKHFWNPYIKVRSSGIHNRGVFARKDIPKGIEVIEYLGKKISKDKSTQIYEINLKEHKKNPGSTGSVYIFDYDETHDLDGDVWWNLAKYVNHSCSPNCEAQTIDNRIVLISKKNIKKGEELSFNYGYDVENWKDHPCYCGSKNCVGYIVSEDQWDILKKKVKRKK